MYFNPDEKLPELAERVMVETEQGSVLFGRRVIRQDNPQLWHWIDDQSLPIRSPVVQWRYIVAPGETPA